MPPLILNLKVVEAFSYYAEKSSGEKISFVTAEKNLWKGVKLSKL